MQLKIKLFDGKLQKKYLEVLSIISLFCSFALLVITIPENLKIYFASSLVFILIVIYIIMWIRANKKKETILNINNTTLIVKIGDIFKEDGFKVIAFNEYFDTQVDDKIIAKSSLNGIYITSIIDDLEDLDNQINSDLYLNNKVIDNNNNRLNGKKNIYELGTIYKHGNYFLTAFAKFDNENKAYLTINDYINFLLNFWKEVDRIYAGCSISIPLLGSGITRFRDCNTMNEQELLEILIWSFKVSGIKFPYSSKVSIIIHESKKDKINFYTLSED